ncbi:MAG TPA: MOSC domain-containing protein [Verrucomicrobiae bacterium]|nr:MOSC domain-containing protein [Verrucomicrobiae bacterium]
MNTTESYATTTELLAGLPQVQAAPVQAGQLRWIIRRPDTDVREVLEAGELTAAAGLVGDRWAARCTRKLPSGALNPDTQLTIMNVRMLALLTRDESRWPEAGDNLLVDLDLSQANLPVGQRLRIGSAILEITTEPHNGCAKFSRRFGPEALKFVNSPEGKALHLRGVYAQVVTDGRVRVGDTITKL